VQDLFDYLTENGPLGETARCKQWFQTIVDTVIEVDHCNVFHSDIKDENLIVDLATDQLLLIDFGAGSFVQTETFEDFYGWQLPRISVHLF
jgi:serine/threonine protein kinase